MRQFVRAFLAGILLLSALAGTSGVLAQAPEAARPALVMLATVEGVIGPPVAHQIQEAIAAADARGAQALILELNTPGGLVTSTREIVTDIVNSPVPVIGYVSPSGGHAASAGTYIMYATHLAAMAPGTNIGAATPVSIGPGGPPPEKDGEQPEDTNAGALDRKAVNDAAAQIRSLAALRGRNADWAERAVREGAALSETEAVGQQVVELIATDVADLVAKLDGRTVAIGGETRVLGTASATIERVEPSWVTEALGVLANPNVAFLLMMIGFYGLNYEFLTPGGVGPGVIGAVCLVLGLYALNQLPLNYAGLALIVLGIGFIIAEAFTPSFGILGIGGVIAFLIGAAMLIDTDVPEYRLSWPVIIAFTALTGGFAAIAVGFAAKSMLKRVATGNESLIGASARVLDWTGEAGHVWANGERWSAEGPAGLAPDQNVWIESVNGLCLRVTAKASQGG